MSKKSFYHSLVRSLIQEEEEDKEKRITQLHRDLDVCFNPFRIDLFSDRFHGGLA